LASSQADALKKYIDLNTFETIVSRVARPSTETPSSVLEHRAFATDGYLIIRGLIAPKRVAELRLQAEAELRACKGPAEYEADLGYPGAPPSRTASGGQTVRRLLDAWARAEVFRSFASDPAVIAVLHTLIGPHVLMPRAHHNCIMTKQPVHSSETGWHQDIRYWSYERPELISVWLALGAESPENGGLWLVPGSHRMALQPSQFDCGQFFRPDLSDNAKLIQTNVAARLNPGDVLFFHCLTLHAAGKNITNDTKYSLVFTYRPEDDPPLPNTRSSASPEIRIA
jgi:phytanoyl-CoA hydroxylase